MADTDTLPFDLLDANGNITGPAPGSLSHLTRTDDMVLVTAEVSGLVPGDATTLWFFVVDLATGAESLGNASGNVVKSDGTLEFGAILREGTNEPGHQVIFSDNPDGELLADVSTALVVLVVQTHGQGRGGKKLREQLSQLEANCTPSCADVQIVFHFPLAP
jgi:hypothetical protein